MPGLWAPSLTLTRAATLLLVPLQNLAALLATCLNLTLSPCVAQRHLLTYPKYSWPAGTVSYDDKNGNAFSGASANGADGASIAAGSITNSGKGNTVSYGKGNGTPGSDVQSTAVGSAKSEVSSSYASICNGIKHKAGAVAYLVQLKLAQHV